MKEIILNILTVRRNGANRTIEIQFIDHIILFS